MFILKTQFTDERVRLHELLEQKSEEYVCLKGVHSSEITEFQNNIRKLKQVYQICEVFIVVVVVYCYCSCCCLLLLLLFIAIVVVVVYCYCSCCCCLLLLLLFIMQLEQEAEMNVASTMEELTRIRDRGTLTEKGLKAEVRYTITCNESFDTHFSLS